MTNKGDSLVFYDKEGNYLNFNYNETLSRYEGDIIFPENSNDTFKTQILYMFENIKAFEYENQSDLTLAKWQLFNEFGFNFYNSNYTFEVIDLIEPINNKTSYYSKWIWGNNFHKKFPLGTVIRFDTPIFEFTNPNQTYIVVSNKKNAILIISLVDNNTFTSTYPFSTYSYGTDTISSLDIIGVYNYIDSTTFNDTLSAWNEQEFYTRIFAGQKLNVVNSFKNDLYSTTHKYIDAAIVTVKNENLIDISHWEYSVSSLPTNADLSIEVILRTDLPLIYTGGLTFYDSINPLNIGINSYSNVLKFSLLPIPDILKPGMVFEVANSVSNSAFLQVDNIPTFIGNSNMVTYNEGNQVLWNNKIYQCIQTFVWTATSSINPNDSDYWGLPTYLPLVDAPVYENLLSGDLYLTSDHLYFTQSFTQSYLTTLASAAQKYSSELKNLNIDLYYDNFTLHADLVYPSQYAIVNYYGLTNSSMTSSLVLGTQKLVYERAIEIDETLKREFNYDYSQNFSYNIVFKNLDEYGFIIKINKEVYQVEIEYVYVSGVIDMVQTIDQTLRNWMINNSIKLITLGVIPTLQTIGVVSPYFNSINLSTEYPNVPLDFKVQVGTTAVFNIEKSQLYFYEPSVEGATPSLGNYININVNGSSYGISNTTLSQTIQNWIDQYSDILDSYGIIVSGLTSSIKFGVLEQHQRCDVTVNAGKSVLPGDYNYKVVNRMLGNHGTLLTSNEIILATWSGNGFEDVGFSTGMITGINSTIYPLQDVEFNVLYLSPGLINLSYEGPFWGLSNSICDTSPFKIVSFNLGFTQSGCNGLTGPGGMFNLFQFGNGFSTNGASGSTSSPINPTNPTYSNIPQNGFGSLDPNYIQRDYLWLHTKDYIRRPRANFSNEPQVTLYWKWFSDNVPEIFLYDFSGDLLPNTGVLAYTGPKPLTTIHLNRNANRNLDRVALPEYQQTIFPVVGSLLTHIDDEFDTSIVPEPIETFIGFNSQIEGPLRSILQLYYKEEVDFTISTYTNHFDIISFQTIYDPTIGATYGLIELDVNAHSNFLTDDLENLRGLKVGQQLAIFIKDETNTKKQYVSPNNGYLVQITDVFYKSIKVNFFKSIDSFTTETTIISDYPKSGNTTYLSVRFKVWDKEIGRFNVYGQTEIEDIRFETELGNVGKLISSDDVYIFKEYDIKEEGIDWVYLNRKRKEMLMMRNMIYPYIGSYKAIINAINYFGYNDLQLNEYYRNINVLSPNYFQLYKVEIPDIFDNTVEGWTDNDFLKHTFPNENYEDTNLFNLTYQITDKEGNNVLNYTLQEVQTKLNGLKHWLEKNIIPITHKILDITGNAYFVAETTISHITRDVKVIKVFEDFTPVSFKLNELYLMPVNNGSTVYNCVLDFYSPTQSYMPYAGITQSDFPDTYTVDIRTYQIYREWYAFKNYMIGDRVVYYSKLYESVIDNNKTNNPRKYENVAEWVYGTTYNVSDIVKYSREFYIYSGYAGVTASVITPYLDTNNWLNITRTSTYGWKEIDLSPIQHITERRKGDNLHPYNFTIDSNIDPYLVIEVSSENGYGAAYRDKKNYEIKGILDLRELESYTNLTSKQYTDAIIGIVYP